MKNLILAVVLMSGISAQANEYWYDFCDVTQVAKAFVTSAYPDVVIDPAKQCNRVAYVFPDNASCIQSRSSSIGEFLNENLVDYKVIVKTEQSKFFDVRITAKREGAGDCRVTKLLLKGISE